MGAYITNANVIARLGTDTAARLSAESGTSPDTALIDTIILEAESIVNAHLVDRVDIPIDQVTYPNAYRYAASHSMTVTIYRLAYRRPPVPEDWKLAYQQAIEELQKVADGDLSLPDDTDGTADLEYGSNDPDRLVV